jgi:PAS domain S-box-containing protein
MVDRVKKRVYMNSSDFEQYKEHVRKSLDLIIDVFAHISIGDFSHRIDLHGIDADDEFAPALFGLDMMMDDILEARNDLKKLTEKLDQDVRESTIELSDANKKLNNELVERKRSEEWFAKREKFFTDIFNSIHDPISILDTDLNIISTNNAMETWYREKMPIAGKKCYWVYHNHDAPCEKCPSLRTIQTGKADFEVVPKRDSAGNDIGWSALYSFPWKDSADGELLGVIEYIKDISDIRMAEEKIQKSEARFRTLAETAGAGIFIVKNAKFVYVNPYFTKTSGYSEKELLDMDFWTIVHPDYKEMLKKRYADRVAGHKAVDEYEFKYVKKNGGWGWVSLNVGLTEFEGGTALIGTLFDITERKKAQEDLAEEKELLTVTMASIGDAVISTDTTGRIISINPVALGYTALSFEETIGKHIDDVFTFFHEKIKDAKDGIVRFMIRNKGLKPMSIRCGLKARTGSERSIDLSVSPINNSKGEVIGMVMVFRDMTERHKLEAELYKARKIESLGVLAGGIAHDFNNILTGIITNLFMAKLKVKSDQETFQLLAEAEKASFRASKLVRQLLTFSKGGAPVKEVVSVREIIEDAVGFCLSGSNVNSSLHFAPDLQKVEADRGQIDQVLNNLIINADQAMPSGGTVAVSVENVSVGEGHISLVPGAYVKVTIKDEGVGIPKESLEKIFDPYFSTKPNGNGLGLTIAYSIIKAHKGVITVESEVGKGTVFSFYLPAAKEQVKPRIAEKSIAAVPVMGDGKKILIMDDDTAVRTVLTQLLKNSGYEVECTASGIEAIEAYVRAKNLGTPFSVVVMDLTIPGGMGGKEAVAKILEIDPAAKVIVASGYSNDPIMANYRKYGFSGVIVKPFNIDGFLSVVKNVLTSG